MRPAHIGALIIVGLAASSAVAQTQPAEPQQTQTMPRAETPVIRGETLHVARPTALIRFDGVRGESQSRPGWIDAWSLTVTCSDAQTAQSGQETRTGDAAGGRHRPHTLTFTHRVDTASPALFDAAATGKRFRGAEVDQAGTKWKIEDAQVTRVLEEARGTSRATETITLSFGKCTRQ